MNFNYPNFVILDACYFVSLHFYVHISFFLNINLWKTCKIAILLEFLPHQIKIIAPAEISPRGEIPRRHPSSSRVY